VTSEAFSSSPIMDLTGYRQRETIEPRTLCVELIVEPSSTRCHPASARASPPCLLVIVVQFCIREARTSPAFHHRAFEFVGPLGIGEQGGLLAEWGGFGTGGFGADEITPIVLSCRIGWEILKDFRGLWERW
jgi:hypothetical protein